MWIGMHELIKCMEFGEKQYLRFKMSLYALEMKMDIMHWKWRHVMKTLSDENIYQAINTRKQADMGGQALI